ncbi:hypothetical protein AX774_g7623 [Zancudomyces culisetae]|uniref:Uncharacterized protein n=1 Tax=Zancudomyces culisetae TaxID=1213189 RepID=A0A1R1PDA0_ZANCU|nr:hypothetical protein AX774_g7623 [Zancudomyces culisetae]|eukprot:OMH78970.1 hypothetical protein AX774_g7623 [Zancudomyces culisetae]
MKVQEISSGIGPSKDKTETQFYQHQHQYQYSKSNSKCSNTSMASSFNSAYYSADQLAGVLSSKPSNVEDKTGISTGPKHDNNSYKNNDGSKSSDNCSNDNNRKRMDTTFTSTSTSTDKDMFAIDQHPEYKILMSKLKRSDDRVQILDEENYTLQMNVSELTTRLEQAEKTHRKERVAATKRGQAEKNYLIQQMAEKQKANENQPNQWGKCL